VSNGQTWPWVVLFLLGAYHGINPGMGWLFAVALGMQKRNSRAVWLSLLPIAVGHTVSIGLVVAVAFFVGAVVPSFYVRIAVACILFAFGVYRLLRRGHPRWGGMQIGLRDLTIWSFLMASAHGAGLMLLPLVMGTFTGHNHHDMPIGTAMSDGPWRGVLAVSVHTLGYLLTTGAMAFAVYQWMGLGLLRKAWVNLDLIWAAALIVTAIAALWL
jgi:hypothetical protein